MATRLALGLAVVLAVIYGSSLDFPFQFDDGHSIVENPHIRSFANVPSFFVDPAMFSVDPSLMMYRPVVLTSYALNYLISQLHPWSYHLLNLLTHLSVVLGVGLLARQLTRSAEGGWLAAWLFAVHPIHSEAVYYISSRSESLACLAVLVAFLLHLRSERWAPIGSVLLLALGLASKSVAIALLPLVLLHDTLVEPGAWRQRWQRHAALWVVALLYVMQTRSIIARATIGDPVRSYTEQWWTQVKAMSYYLHLLVIPRGLSVDHQFLISDSLLDPYAAAALAVCGSLLLVLLRLGRRRLSLFLALWFLVALAPASLVPLNVIVNEHRLYLAGVGVAIGLAALVLPNDRARRGLAWTLPLLALLTSQRGEVWASHEALWQDAVRKAPGMARPHIMLGQVYQLQGDDARTIKWLDAALVRDSTYAPAYVSLSDAHARLGDMEAAARMARRGAHVLPDSVGMWSHLAQIERTVAMASSSGSARSAAFEASALAYEHALRLSPDDADLHDNLGNTYQELGRPGQALPHHQRAVFLRPTRAVSRLNHGNVLFMMGDLKGAAAEYRTAIRLAPNDAAAWASLSLVLQRLEHVEDAASAWKRAQALGWGAGGR
ncbi:MAG: tetratricopeptide repeat protein [Gemmatimonadetes bacterium]|nr:tetratricopeptide repeat protein [Gemmatimonadota bacterium]MBT7861101.1 tetratricopeptide repeat protein [Gemmatimonadota bacterium]